MLNFPPQLIRHCSDIREEIKNFCSKVKLDADHVGFELLAVEVLLDKNDKRGMCAVTQEELAQLEDEEVFNKHGFKLKSRYDIRIKPVDVKPNARTTLRISPFGDEMRLFLPERMVLVDQESFYDSMMRDIEAKMAYEGIFIRKKDKIRERLKSYIQKILTNKLTLPCEILLLESQIYRPYQESYCEFLLACDEKIKNHKEAYFAINKGEDVMVFHKPRLAVSGRNLYGKFIAAKNANPSSQACLPKYNHSEIEKIELEDRIVLKSLVDSYVCLKDNEINFYHQSDFNYINAESTPPLLGGASKNMTLTIVASDRNADAIGQGVVLEAARIKIIGNIAKNTKIQALDLEIQGSTHPESEIIAARAKISTHRGSLITNEAYIDVLNQGSVQSKNLEIEHCREGKILSKKARIKNAYSDNQITISYRLTLGSIQGQNNVITISSSAYHKRREFIQDLVKKRDMLISSAKEAYNRYHKILTSVKKNKRLIDQIDGAQDLVREQMMKNKDIAEAYGNYYQMLKDMHVFKQELLDYQQAIEKVANHLVEIDQEVLNVQIYCDGSWGDGAQLVYQREFPKKQVKSLVVSGDFKGGYRIDAQTQEFVSYH